LINGDDEFPRPVGRFDLVVNQLVDGLRIGNPQQRFRQAHQANALVRRQPVLGEKAFHHRRRGFISDLVDDLRACSGNFTALAGVEPNLRDQLPNDTGLIGRVVGSNCIT